MDMEQSNGMQKLNVLRYVEISAFLNTPKEMPVILAIDIVNMKNLPYIANVSREQCLT
jgi:hypothetical protein